MRKETQLPNGLEWPEDERFNYFAVDWCRDAYFYEKEPFISDNGEVWYYVDGDIMEVERKIEVMDWQNSLQYRWEEAETANNEGEAFVDIIFNGGVTPQTTTPDERPIHRYIVYPKDGTPYTTSWVMELETSAIIFDKANDTYSRDFGQTWHEMESDHL